jgi:hypothetical protein
MPRVFVREGSVRIVRRGNENGSPGGIRTPDTVVNSHLLCRLSYRGMGEEMKMRIMGIHKTEEKLPQADQFFKTSR